MIPSLVAQEIRGAVIEYLTTTFALADDDARAALAELLTDPGRGMFRGPYLRVRTPYHQVPESWESPLGWLPDGFRPFVHQAEAFCRLSSLDHDPEPVIVTSGTGSGKTESFLLPILDHCRRHRGTPGIKALLLYPMNALATDQARRIAGYVHENAELDGVTAGLYIGGQGTRDRMRPRVAAGVTDKRVLRIPRYGGKRRAEHTAELGPQRGYRWQTWLTRCLRVIMADGVGRNLAGPGLAWSCWFLGPQDRNRSQRYPDQENDKGNSHPVSWPPPPDMRIRRVQRRQNRRNGHEASRAESNYPPGGNRVNPPCVRPLHLPQTTGSAPMTSE